MTNKDYNKIEEIRLKSNKNTMDIIRLAFKFYPKESRDFMIKVNEWDGKISKLLNEFTMDGRREDKLILNDLEKLRAENNSNWMELYKLADAGSSKEYKKLKDKAKNLWKNDECFIIAEVGINHNGKLDIAKKMVLEAKICGCDAVKFQTFKAEEFITDKNLTYTYKSQGEEITESQIDMFKRYEFNR